MFHNTARAENSNPTFGGWLETLAIITAMDVSCEICTDATKAYY